MKKVSVAKRSAASRKAWRTRKKMQAAREKTPMEMLPSYYPDDLKKELINTAIGEFFDLLEWPGAKPAYMRRALPCPNFGDKR